MEDLEKRNEALDEVTNDDGISHIVEGGLSLKLRYEMMPNKLL